MSKTTEGPTESVLVADVPERRRFEISVDGIPVGFTDYVDAGCEGADESAGEGAGAGAGAGAVERTFTHTEIDEAFGGRRLSTLLIRTALDAARIGGLRVVPQCSAVQHFIAKNADYLDLVPAARRAEHGL